AGRGGAAGGARRNPRGDIRERGADGRDGRAAGAGRKVVRGRQAPSRVGREFLKAHCGEGFVMAGHGKDGKRVARGQERAAAATTVVHPCDETSLRGPCEAAEAGIIRPIFVGPPARIKAVADKNKIDIGKYEMVGVEHSDAAAAKGVEMIRAGNAEL